MINTIRYSPWGSKHAFTRLYGIPNTSDRPMAELWIGEYADNSSYISDDKGNVVSLRMFIEQDPIEKLGANVFSRFGELPFLFKVLCVEQPISVQVHPDLVSARSGFFRENQINIALNAPNRNYKDANHKPELVFALTPFHAMNGFRHIKHIVSLLHPISHAHSSISDFLSYPDTQNLAQMFRELLLLKGNQKYLALNLLKDILSSHHGEPWDTIRIIEDIYPDDNSLFLPLLLNVITLQPDQAMFLPTGTPHAYLKGIALEVMAKSDNVLRAGMTKKYVNVPELIANTIFTSKSQRELLTDPEELDEELMFSVPVDDFNFSVHRLTSLPRLLRQKSATIFFCIDGQAMMVSQGQSFMIRSGESVFVAANDPPVEISGMGRLSRVYNQL